MLDKSDLQAIAEMISASEERMIAAMDSKIAVSEARMKAFVASKIETSEAQTAQKILASEMRLKSYIDERAKEAESRAVSYAENEVTRRQGVIKEGLDLALELPRIPVERVELIEQDVEALKYAVQNQGKKIDELQRSA